MRVEMCIAGVCDAYTEKGACRLPVALKGKGELHFEALDAYVSSTIALFPLVSFLAFCAGFARQLRVLHPASPSKSTRFTALANRQLPLK